MDIATLLYGFRPATASAAARKTVALKTAAEMLRRHSPDVDALAHFNGVAASVIANQFGSDAEDAYFTSTLTLLMEELPHLDSFLAAVLNSIVLRMNFQTRLSRSGVMGAPEAIVYEGDLELFPAAMIHGNQTLGVHVTDASPTDDLPGWAKYYPVIELEPRHLHRVAPREVNGRLVSFGRDRIGALMVVKPVAALGEFSLRSRYAYLDGMTSVDTLYVVAGPAEMTMAFARNALDRYPNCQVRMRLYPNAIGLACEYLGITIIHGIEELPDIVVRPGIHRECSFIQAAPKDAEPHPDIGICDYFGGRTDRVEYSGENCDLPIGRWEPSDIALPFYLTSSAPLPEEARGRISDATELYHSVAVLKNGVLIPSQDHEHSTYIHATEGGEVVTDYGDEGRNVFATPLFRHSVIDEQGVRRNRLVADHLLRVDCEAMPLAFTPMLHKWHSHFIIQCLPRVKIVRDLGDTACLLVSDGLRPKQLEMLAILGFPAERLIPVHDHALVQARRILLPRAWRLAFTSYTASIYDEIVAHFPTRDPGPARRVLISRESRKTWRNLLNYETVREMLTSDYGFVEVSPEKMTLAEEVALYSDAEIVVGAEGAGLYGAVFSRPGARYISIGDEDYIMPILGTLAAVRGLSVGYVFGESMREDSDLARRLPFGHADFVVDPIRVRAAVEAAIGS